MDRLSRRSPTSTNICSRICHYLSYVTVEPSLTLYMMAFMITSVIEQSLFVYKACRVDHGYNETVCRNISQPEYSDINKKVQITVSNFILWNNVAGHAGQIILAFFMGAWSDKRGRKLPLIIGLIGKLYYSVMIVVNSLKPDWPVMYIVYTATLPMTITGADVAIFAAAFTYLVDVSSKENRTIRVTLLEVCYLATMPTGIALGSFIYSKVNQSYTIMFIINASLLGAAILYSFVRLEWQTAANQKPLMEVKNILTDFFDYNHVVDTVKTLSKRRENKKRRILLMLILMMALYTFQRDERTVTFLYCQRAFNWDVSQYSTFRTFQSALQDLGLLFGVPILSKCLGFRDSIIVMVGAFAHSCARVFYAAAIDTWIFYIGGVFAAFGPIVAPVIRSMVSKIIHISEKGKAFSVLGVADNAIPIISGVLYSKLYSLTITSHPAAIFYLTIGSQIGVFLLVLYIHFVYKEDQAPNDQEESQDKCLSEGQPQDSTEVD
ncbi:proton-coupled folate transporter [Sitophilus oryzae]|uniref:Proton-coupled folate transporter n=1 Tax=Sitophilus oryzae TaxID=7048 RepID=A0A6J2XL76_SITOR|nr:proton-coupled folate transporter [Sitophilus oryzae]XP_030751846.1 proton-coupled folate transporter [Sitophilus oryzae]